MNQLRAIFDQIIEFQSAQDSLYRSALEERALRLQFEEKKQQREEEEVGGLPGCTQRGKDRGDGNTTGVKVTLSCPLIQGQWGVTAEQEAEEKKRIQDFQDTIPKMRSQLRILTHFYQVPA